MICVCFVLHGHAVAGTPANPADGKIAVIIDTDDRGYTKLAQGPPNVDVCLEANGDKFYTFFMERMSQSPPAEVK